MLLLNLVKFYLIGKSLIVVVVVCRDDICVLNFWFFLYVVYINLCFKFLFKIVIVKVLSLRIVFVFVIDYVI